MTSLIEFCMYGFMTLLILVALWLVFPYIGIPNVAAPNLDGMYCKDNITYTRQMCDEFCINHYTKELYGDGLYGLPGQQNVTAFCKCCDYKLKHGEL